MKTYYLVEVDHDKPLPADKLDATDVLSQRLYTFLHAMGIRCDVTVKSIQQAMKEKASDPA